MIKIETIEILGYSVNAFITAPLYWWNEFMPIPYVIRSNIIDKEFTLEDFSYDHLITGKEPFDEESSICFHDCNLDRGEICSKTFEYEFNPIYPIDILEKAIIPMLNECRFVFLETHDKKCWWQIMQLLPNSYNQCQKVLLAYKDLAKIYSKYKNNELDEWFSFCEWIKTLPNSETIILGDEKEKP